ncbi:hypothetical protein GGS20DRAFT_344095 [Poronia punctata]|nr:hypothetical protein GGS20DRAFT_344095 [Poronia punctata]
MMLPSTVRRLATAAPQSTLLTPFVPTTTRATAALTLNNNPRCNQRRRYSSSKPSSPNDSPKNPPAGTVSTSPVQSTKQSGEKRKRKTKDMSTRQKLPTVPSVPSTQDMPQEALAVSSFFSLHRPISVTHSFPRAITDDAFAQIFAARSKASYNRVMSTIARTVDQLEHPMQGLTMSPQQVGDGSAANDMSNSPLQQIMFKAGEGAESSLDLQLDQASGAYLPFHPPPVPKPLSAGESEVGASDRAQTRAMMLEGDAALEHEPQARTYKAVFTLEETTDKHGNVRITAHSPQLLEEHDGEESYGVSNPPRSFLERMALRQIRREHVRGQASGMLAISVKRQRKLKMKKKKYKKLMRRTRNERRKLDRV